MNAPSHWRQPGRGLAGKEGVSGDLHVLGGHSCWVVVGLQGVKACTVKTVKSEVRHGAGVRLSTGSGDTGLPDTNRMPQLYLYSRYTRTDCA